MQQQVKQKENGAACGAEHGEAVPGHEVLFEALVGGGETVPEVHNENLAKEVLQKSYTELESLF